MQNFSISFVMPAYNCADTVIEAVESIINGNFEQGDEIIIVNDCSTDNTSQILLDLKKKYPFIILIRNPENKGCPASRNIGIDKALNSIIFNLDADDVLVPGSRRNLQEYMISENADVAAFGKIHYFQKSIKEVTHKWICPSGVLTLADFLSGPIVPGGNYIYTKESWNKVGRYSEYGKGLHEFWDFSLKQIASGSKFVVLHDTYYFHRYGTNSLYMREVKKQNGSLLATKMIMPFIDLIDESDAKYIKSSSKNWFDKLDRRPVRVKTGEIGRKGYISYPLKTRIYIQVLHFNNKIKSYIKKIPFIVPLYKQIKFYINFRQDFNKFKSLSLNTRFLLNWRDCYLCLNAATKETGVDRHCVYYTAWAARVLKQTKPEVHIDISSSLYFVSVVSAFIPVKFYDYLHSDLNLSNLEIDYVDLTSLPFADESIKSISCMHVVEHIGLGRYGESLDSDGDLKVISELKRVVKSGGVLLFVVPIGKPKIRFNAHRIYSYEQIISYFQGFELKEFSLIPDNPDDDGLIINATKEMSANQNYGCGCFYFIKKS